MDVLGNGLAGRTMARLTRDVPNSPEDGVFKKGTAFCALLFETWFLNFLKCMKTTQLPLYGLLAFLSLWTVFLYELPAHGQFSTALEAQGIQPLIPLNNGSVHQLIPKNVRPLLDKKELEQFLLELEGLPPDWSTLKDPDHTRQSERLFQLNRQRDQARLDRKHLIQQPVAFIWAGMLRQYLPEYQGFLVALGPEFTSTSWGIVRFKPTGLPDYLIAVPSDEAELLAQQENGKQIDIGVLFIGTLVPEESLIYGFSHEGEEEGMILPVVQIQDVKYFLATP
jgi:hypothetical protein